MFPSLPGPPASADFLAAVCLASLGMTLAIVAFVHGVLRERAGARGRAPGTGGPPSATTRFFARPASVRLAFSAFAILLLFGLVAQAVWGLLLVYPPSPAWLELDAPGLLPLLVWGLACLGPALMAAALAPSWSLAARQARLQRRFPGLDPALRHQILRHVAVAAGCLGGALDLLLLYRIAGRLFPEAF